MSSADTYIHKRHWMRDDGRTSCGAEGRTRRPGVVVRAAKAKHAVNCRVCRWMLKPAKERKLKKD